MIEIAEMAPVRDVIARYGLSAKRSLGQNFLLDLNLTRRIARSAGDLQNATVVEIGPGPGALTRALLLEGARHIIAIERDERCVAALEELAAAARGRLEIICADAITIDELSLLSHRPKGELTKIVANLPYNISTVLLTKWLESEPWPPVFESFTLLFQKEVAQRLRAAPRTKAYGRLSVLTQWRAKPQALFDIAPSAFTPAPKVVSTLMRIEPRQHPLALADRRVLTEVTAAAFGQRRKMLRSSLAKTGVDLNAIFSQTGIYPTSRAEELSVEDFCAIARIVEILRA